MKVQRINTAKIQAAFVYRDGNIYWRYSPKPGVNAGDRAGSVAGRYITTELGGVKYQVHRLVWVLVHGVDPYPYLLDHIDRNGLNNRIENLRLVDFRQNNLNRGIQKNNTTGFTGVFWNKRKQKYHAAIRLPSGVEHLGSFENPADASAAYKAARSIHFGEFA